MMLNKQHSTLRLVPKISKNLIVWKKRKYTVNIQAR